MKIDIDAKERMKIICIFFLQFYKIIMGTMLSLFVSQKCINNDDTVRICSLKDNLFTDDIYHQMVLGLNGITLLLFIYLYSVELKRENYCIKQFDINHTFPDNNITNIIDSKPEVKLQITKINKHYYNISRIMVIVYFINFISSFGIVFNEDKRNGSTTYTGFLSFTLLVGSKLWDSFSVSRKSYLKNVIQSSYLKEYSSFNIFDPDLPNQMSAIAGA